MVELIGDTEEGITGDVFVTMLHDDLKELGVDSMGHRLTILKAIYEVKIRHKIPIEIDQFVPLCKICKHLRPETLLTIDSCWCQCRCPWAHHSRRYQQYSLPDQVKRCQNPRSRGRAQNSKVSS